MEYKKFLVNDHVTMRHFTLSSFNKIKTSLSINELINFQSENKYLFMAYSPQKQKELGRIIANHKSAEINDVFHFFEEVLYQLFAIPPSRNSNVNALQHIFGYFSKKLSPEEKCLFLSFIEKYQQGLVTINTLLQLLQSWAIQFNQPYLINQSFFTTH